MIKLFIIINLNKIVKSTEALYQMVKSEEKKVDHKKKV